MPIPPYIVELRAKIGQALLLLPAAAAIVQDDRGRVLLIRRGDGRGWSLPGGMMEPGERIAEAAVREVWEETALEFEQIDKGEEWGYNSQRSAPVAELAYAAG